VHVDLAVGVTESEDLRVAGGLNGPSRRGDRKSNSQVRISLARAAGEYLQQDHPHRLRVVDTYSEHLCAVAQKP